MAGITERERAIRTERAELWTAMQPAVEKVGRGEKLTVEERTEYEARDAKLTDLGTELKTVISMRNHESEQRANEPETRGATGADAEDREKREWAALRRYLAAGDNSLTREDRAVLRPQVGGQPLEQRIDGPDGDTAPMQSPVTVALSEGSAGGYLVPPGFWQNLQVALKAYGGVYPYFRQVETATGAPMSWPTTNPTTTVAVLMTTENTQLTPQDETFGFGQLLAYTYVAGPFLASIQLLNDSAFSVDGFVRDRISEAIGRSQAAAAWSGTGSAEPLGLSAAIVSQGQSGTTDSSFTPGTGGVYLEATEGATHVTTIGTLAADNTTTNLEATVGAMSFATVFDLIAIVDPAYRGVSNAGPSADETSRNPAWFMNDATLQNQRQVTDQYGRPLIQQNFNMGGNTLGETLGGYPVVIDNNAPSITGAVTPTVAGASGPVFGSLHHAMVARNVNQVGVMRLNERFADYLSVAWIGYMRYDIRSNDLRAVSQKSYASTT